MSCALVPDVNSASLDNVMRDEAGKPCVALRGRREKMVLSRFYLHLFKAI